MSGDLNSPRGGDGGELHAQLSLIERLLKSDPVAAEQQAIRCLATSPGQPMARLFRGIACRLLGKPAEAIQVLEPLCRDWPDAPMPHLQLGLAMQEEQRHEAAVEAMRRAVAAKPDFADAWLALAELHVAMNDRPSAAAAFNSYVQYSAHDPEISQAASAILRNRAAEAASLLRARLERHPADVAALCLLADATLRQNRPDDAEALLRRCLELAPGYRAARHNFALLLLRQNLPVEALRECDELLAGTPDDASVLKLKANILRHLGRYAACVEIYQALLERDHAQPRIWTSLGHSLRALGESTHCISAYRRAVALEPQLGEAYWSLANLGMRQLSDADVLAMQNQLKNPLLSQDDRIHLHFAIGKGLEARGEFEASFRHYVDGNRLRRQGSGYDASEFTRLVRRLKERFSAAFFAERKNCGADAVDPIFVVGLPRAGSTLVEQILASHSAVEGTGELPDLAMLVKSVDRRMAAAGQGRYPEAVTALGSSELRELGRRYVEQTRVQRKEGKPLFVDKMPNNFIHAGFIHLILPHARIIDVRRHPMACGLSLFKLLFAYGQPFSYSLGDIGRYYRDYADLMTHYDSVLPGRVHRIHYESLVTDTETEVRSLLNYCGLPFQPSCLNFHENRRPVATPASEQVRLPVYRDAAEHWRHYERWLEPLKSALGTLADDYPMPPALR